MVAERSEAQNSKLIKEIRKIAERPVEVNYTVTTNVDMDGDVFGRSINKHFGAYGSKPANSAV